MKYIDLNLTSEAWLSEIATHFGVTPQVSLSLCSLALIALMDAGHQSRGFVLALFCFGQGHVPFILVELYPLMEMQLASVHTEFGF